MPIVFNRLLAVYGVLGNEKNSHIAFDIFADDSTYCL